MWNTETKFSQNLNTLKSLTKKLNYLFHIKWHRRRKSLTFSKQIYCKSSIIFCRFSQKKKRLVSLLFNRDGRVAANRNVFCFLALGKNLAFESFQLFNFAYCLFFNRTKLFETNEHVFEKFESRKFYY